MHQVKIIFLLHLLSILSCRAQQSDEDNIKQSVATFYNWYIATIKGDRYTKLIKAVPDKKGNKTLDATLYFKALDSLGVIHPSFIESERQRLKPCSDFLTSMLWEKFNAAEGFSAEDQCGFLYYYYWTRGHEPHDGVRIGDVRIDGSTAAAETSIIFNNNEIAPEAAVISLIKKRNRWLISAILFSTNQQKR